MNFSMQKPTAPELLDTLVGDRSAKFPFPVMIVVAHPDDETIGIGAQLSRLQNVTLVHVTDGSPANLSDAHRAGFSNTHDYAAARRIELNTSLSLAGIQPRNALALNFPDQEAVFHLPEITRTLKALVARFTPAMVFTHPYEGGHPDHDATAFCIHSACEDLAIPPPLVEMTFYHRNASGMVTGEFLLAKTQGFGLPIGGEQVWRAQLTQEEMRTKRRMFDSFTTQKRVLSAFSLESESFRLAPHYDFSIPPHPGRLHYEQLPLGINAERFSEMIHRAIRARSYEGK